VGALAERLLEFRAAGEAQHLWGLSGELPVGISGQVQPAGDTATRELVVQVAANSPVRDSIP
jgi:hypothetical protein